MTGRSRAWITVSPAVLTAFLLRAAASWPAVFRADGVGFQEGDAWFHVRTVHNLLAHFPVRSAFDPYMFFPGGQTVPTGPAWDYIIASVAWVLGTGSPSPALVDGCAAVLPALFGAAFVAPVFFLARRLFGFASAVFAAIWAATTPGAFLWFTHLGLADHHAAEALFAFLTLTCLCLALEKEDAALPWAAASGLAMGAFLATRPAGIFVPGTLALVAVFAPRTARSILTAVCAASVVFLPVTGILWSNYTWLALGTAAISAGISIFLRGKLRWLAILACVAAGAILRPAITSWLWFEVRRMLGWTPASRIAETVQELQPVFRAGNHPGWGAVFDQAGIIWLFALPALFWLLWRAAVTRRTSLVLLGVWSVVMTIAATIELRMVVYFAPVAAILAGAACAEVTRLVDVASRGMWAAGLAVLIAAINLWQGIPQVRADHSPSPDWHRALQWLRRNSPEPFSDPAVWRSAVFSPLPVPAKWGVLVWWDFGYHVEQIGRRIPMANGTQAGTEDMARFFLDTVPESAMKWARANHARYAVSDPSSVATAGSRTWFPLAAQILGRNPDDYFRVLARPAGANSAEPVFIYLPDYYRTMAARLYLGRGKAVPGGKPWIFETESVTARDGRTVEIIRNAQQFPTEAEAANWMTLHGDRRLVMGCPNATASCFALSEVNGIREVYASDSQPVSAASQTVRIFEIAE